MRGYHLAILESGHRVGLLQIRKKRIQVPYEYGRQVLRSGFPGSGCAQVLNRRFEQ
jgi:hypothetical protein